MPSDTVAGMPDRAPRIGLVLGAGGVAGGAFHAGVVAAIAEATGWDPRRATHVVGTSAGSITGASLRAGFPAADLLARAQDKPLSAEGQRVMLKVGPIAQPPSLRPVRTARAPADMVATLARAARRPFAARPSALLAALLPEGSISTDMISEGIGGLFPRSWPSEPLWICAVRQADGRRVVFGRDGERPSVAEAVAASCAIPGFFSPVAIGDHSYIDGGVHSPTNADVLRDTELDLVVISSPMSRQGRRPRLAADQAMRTWAGALLDAEAMRLRRRQIPVLAFQPDAAVLTEMGLNPMDPLRRSAIAGAARESALRKVARADVRDRLQVLQP
jgi:NTE family protein